MSQEPKIDALDARLKDFADLHIHGWGHEDWDGLVKELAADGHDVSDTGALGLRLERMHIVTTLERLALPGIGEKRRERVADHFPTLWRLRQADVEELAAIPTFHRALAETLHEGLARRTGGF